MQAREFDIILLGGGISSTLLSISILRKHPNYRILIVEKNGSFEQKIGESTSDITALFLRRFGIDHILEKHVQKTGLRFLFNESLSDEKKDVAEFSSPTFDGPNNGFQLNRKLFDEELLQLAIELGAEILRPCTIIDGSFGEFNNQLTLAHQQKEIKVAAKWFVDASGRSRYIHDNLEWKDLETRLKTAAVFAHFTDVSDSESWNIPANEYWDANAVGESSLSTIHFMRENAWWWLIKIDDKTTSIGYVYNKDGISIDDPIAHYLQAIRTDPQIKSIVQDAQHSDPKFVDDLAYQSEKLFAKGIALIGDSAAFVDPMVSPGIEMICQQVLWLSELIPQSAEPAAFPERKWQKYEDKFTRAFQDRMNIYQKGYRYMGSYDLSANWLQIGLFAYFGIHVFKAFIFKRRLKVPFTISPLGRLGFTYIVGRLNRIDKRRKRQGRTSNSKDEAVTYSSFYYPKGVFFYTIPFRMFFKWLGRYLMLELKEIKYLFKK